VVVIYCVTGWLLYIVTGVLVYMQYTSSKYYIVILKVIWTGQTI